MLIAPYLYLGEGVIGDMQIIYYIKNNKSIENVGAIDDIENIKLKDGQELEVLEEVEEIEEIKLRINFYRYLLKDRMQIKEVLDKAS